LFRTTHTLSSVEDIRGEAQIKWDRKEEQERSGLSAYKGEGDEPPALQTICSYGRRRQAIYPQAVYGLDHYPNNIVPRRLLLTWNHGPLTCHEADKNG
jgi:hypothetical protein